MGCCKATTKWKIEEKKWRIVLEGLNAGGQKSFSNIGSCPDGPLGCSDWILMNPWSQAAFNKPTEKIQNTSIIRKLISGPDGNNCPNINGGKIVGSPNKQNESRTPSKISIFPVRVPNGGSTY